MEEISDAGAGAAASEHLDPVLQRKHAAMIERLSNLHQTRLTRKPESSSTSSFLSRFSESKNSIESTLTRIQQTPDPHSDPTLKPELDRVSVSISDLEKLVAENSFSLPSYEVRTCLKTLTELKQFVEQVTCTVIPKKKFSFKNKNTKKITSRSDNVLGNENENAVSVNLGIRVSDSPGNGKIRGNQHVVSGNLGNRDLDSPGNDENMGNQNAVSGNLGIRVLDSPGFRGKENEVLIKEFDEGIREFVLTDLRGCEVRLMGCVRALFVNKLIGCKVYVGPVLGSVLIEEVEDCVFVMAAHQIRIHEAKKCDFYLRVRSRPIIEDSNGIRFAPYCLKYDGIENDLEEANLGEETGNWSNVDDFKWLRAVQSPNWSILPENECIGIVEICNRDTQV